MLRIQDGLHSHLELPRGLLRVGTYVLSRILNVGNHLTLAATKLTSSPKVESREKVHVRTKMTKIPQNHLDFDQIGAPPNVEILATFTQRILPIRWYCQLAVGRVSRLNPVSTTTWTLSYLSNESSWSATSDLVVSGD